MEGGTHTHHMRDRNPSISAPNWSTILTGMTPEQTGIIDNGWVPADSNPATVTTDYLPPVTGAGKIPTTMWNIAKE